MLRPVHRSIRRRFAFASILALTLAGPPAEAALRAYQPFVLPGEATQLTSAGNGDGLSVLGWQEVDGIFHTHKNVQISRLGAPVHDPVVLPPGGYVISQEVVPNGDGGTFIVWLENDCPVCSPPPPSELYLQRISADGRLAGDPVLLPSMWLVDVLARNGGVSVLTWETVDGDNDHVLRSFDGLGRPVGDPVPLGLSGPEITGFVQGQELAGADVLTVREVLDCEVLDCRPTSLVARRVIAGGVSGDTVLADHAQGFDLASLPGGRFLVTWLETDSPASVGPTSYRIRAQEWTPEGPGKVLALPSDLMGPQHSFVTRSWVSVAADGEGRVMLVWVDQPGQDAEARLKVQAFDHDLEPVGLPFEPGIRPGYEADQPQVVAEADGEFLVTWLSTLARETSIAGQRFRFDTGPCEPSERSLCFFGGRFAGEAFFRTPQGHVDWSAFTPLSDQAGYGWFGRQSNPELLLKMLNGNPVNGHFWLFAGSLTTSVVEMRLLDTTTGEVRHFSKPAGSLLGFGEKQAFEADPPIVPLAARAVAASELLPLPAGLGLEAGAVGTCVPSSTTVCLLEGRFRLKLGWSVGPGRGGEASGQALTESSGVFWFRQERNPEVIVKILDGTAVHGRYWLFFGAATTAAIDLTVTDTLTGISRTYLSRASSFEGGRDLRSFGP